MENLSFGLTSGWHALTIPKPDVIYANTWPIVAVGILCFIARLRRVPLVMSMQDVYPESLIAQGRIKEDSALACLFRWADAMIARGSRQLIVISDRIEGIYRDRRSVAAERIILIPNWIDISQIEANTSCQQYRRSLGITAHSFLIVYGGNIGMAAGLEKVIEALGLLRDKTKFRLLIAGSGSQLHACRRHAERIAVESVTFHSPWSVDKNPEVLRIADLLILPTRGRQSLTALPSKLLSYMLAGRPVLASAVPESDLAEIVADANCGWVVQPDRPDLLAKQVEAIMRMDPSERQQKGENGRKYVLAHFSKDVCLPKVIQILEDASR